MRVPASRDAERHGGWRAALAPLFTLFLFAAALVAVDRILAEYRYAEIAQALGRVRAGALALALAATGLGYLALVGCDYVAFRIVGRRLPLRAMLVPSFVSFAVSNSAPASVVTAGGVRYRMYAERGLTVAEAAAVAGINVATYALGLCALGGVALLAGPVSTPGAPAWIARSGRTLGVLLLLAVAAYLAATATRHQWSGRLRRAPRVPSVRLAGAQLGVSAADWLLSSGALYVLLADVGRLPYLAFLARFLVAAVVTLVAPVPGGLGVFEAVVLYLTSSGSPAPRVLAALLVYRVTYYLVPLLAAGAVLLAQELRRAGRRGVRPTAWLGALATGATPHLVAFATFVAGWMLLLTGTIPADERRLAWLARVLPLQLMDVSHFLASVLGAALLIVAWGLERRVRTAYRAARLLFGAGIVLSLLRAADVRLAAGLAVALLVLVAADRAFPRGAERSLLREPLGAAWVLAIGAAVVVTVWVGAFAFHGVDYSREPWWRVTLEGHAPRALRAAVGMSVTVLLFALARRLARAAPRPRRGARTTP